jgi:isopenicillin-N N-acyltransferase-like protein
MRVIEVAGSPSAMGEQLGEAEREAIHALYAARMRNCRDQAAQYGGRAVDEGWILRAAERCLPHVQAYAPAGLAELEGVARGARLELRQVWAMNALTDLRDVAAFADPGLGQTEGEGCSSLVAQGAAVAGGGVLLGQTWDLATDNMPFVRVVHRRPEAGPETLALTTVGCLCLIGLNDVGLAVGTTNLRTTDARPGVGYLDVIHRALGETSFEAARRAIRDAPRAGAHYYYLGSVEGRVTTFECTAARAVERPVEDDVHVHCNHALEPENAALEAEGMPVASTHHRQARLTALASTARPLEPRALQGFFADIDGGPLAINRKGFGGISSNGSVVMALDREGLRFWAVHGPADEGAWIARALGRHLMA